MNSVVIIGGSAGSFRIIRQLIRVLPTSFSFGLIICVHRLRTIKTGLADALAETIEIPIIEPTDKEEIQPGVIYIAPANYHLLIEPGEIFTLSTFRRFNHSRPSIDLTMKSAAEVCGQGLTGILLSGANADGVEGMMHIRDHGGTTIVQDPDEAEINVMPNFAVSSFVPDHIYTAEKIITFIENLNRST